MKSDNAKKGIARAPHRSLFYAMGYTKEELEKESKEESNNGRESESVDTDTE